jgi:hypothetical protein
VNFFLQFNSEPDPVGSENLRGIRIQGKSFRNRIRAVPDPQLILRKTTLKKLIKFDKCSILICKFHFFKKIPKKLISRHNIQPYTFTGLEYKGKINVRILEQTHVGSETGSGFKTNGKVGSGFRY